jgi:hypothetical protein
MNKDAALYLIDESFDSKVAGNVLGENYEGVLTTDSLFQLQQTQDLAKAALPGASPARD